MGGTSTTTTNTSSTPTFSGEGQALLQQLMGQAGKSPGDSQAGQYLTSMLSAQNPYMEQQVSAIRQQSERELPKALASARSMTRGRPDTFADQTMGRVASETMANRDMNILNLLSGQFNQDRAFGGQAANTLLGADAQQFGNQNSLLSLLRGEDTSSKEVTKKSNPMQTALMVAAAVAAPFTGGASLAALPAIQGMDG